MFIYIMTYASKPIIDALKAARQSAGLSQRQLSARTGLPQSHISKIENGRGDITLSTLIELARVLDLDVMLVPRKLVPAVANLGATGHTDEEAPRPAYMLDDEEDDDDA